MKPFVPLQKRSKREKKRYYDSQRGTWHGVCPASRTVESATRYNRRQAKREISNVLNSWHE